MDVAQGVSAVLDVVRSCKKITNKEVMAIAVILGDMRAQGARESRQKLLERAQQCLRELKAE